MPPNRKFSASAARWVFGNTAVLVFATGCSTFDDLQREQAEDGGDGAPRDAQLEGAPPQTEGAPPMPWVDGSSDSGSDATPEMQPDVAPRPIPLGPPQRLTPPDSSATNMGYRGAIEGDTAIVGAWDAQRIGSAYAIDRDGVGHWSIVQTLTAEQYAGPGEYFGVSVAMSGDWALIGAHGGYGRTRPGHVLVFQRTSSDWTLVDRLEAPVPANGDQFGYAVAMQGDVAVIGAPEGSDFGSGYGAMYVYRRDALGQWSFWQELVVPGLAAGDSLGVDVAIDATTIVGCAHFDDEKGANAGAAHAFTLSQGTWSFADKLLPPVDNAAGMIFCGEQASLDGDSLFIGSWTGGAFLLTRDGNGVWSNEPILPPTEAQPTSGFGWTTEVRGDLAIVGMRGIGDVGSGYLYRRSNGIWEFDQRFDASTTTANLFTWTVEIDGTTALVGATGEDGGRGAIYFYEIPP